MALINVPMVSFSGGEIGPESMARVDLDVYPSTAEEMEYVLPLMQGAMIKAPGTEYIGRTLNDTAAIVRPFIYNVDQTRVLEISDGQMLIVDGNAYVDIDGGTATIGDVADNGSINGSSIDPSGSNKNVTFINAAGGESRAYWPITAGQANVPTTLRFEITRRPVAIRIGTTTSAEDILSEITLDPGIHIITFTPTANSYYFRARLLETGRATLKGITRLAAGEFAIPTPWTGDQLAGLRLEQSNDVVWLYHPEHRTRVLERRANTSWSLRLFRPKKGPFESPNQTDVTLQPNARTGSIKVYASESFFGAGRLGQLIEITHQGQTESVAVNSVDDATEAIRVTGVESKRSFTVAVSGTFSATLKLQQSAGNDVDWQDHSTVSAGVVTIDDDLDNQIIYYRVICTAYTSGVADVVVSYPGGETTGRGEIVQIGSPVFAYVEVYEDFGSTNAVTNWSEGAWCDNYGWPAAGQIDDGRHCLVRDDRFWAGESDDYEEFLIGTDDSAAIARRLGTGDVNTARWIESASRLVIGTSGAEMEISSNAFNDPITPTAIKARGFDDVGSANAAAVKAGNRIVYIDRTRARLMQCLYSVENDAHDTDDLCRLHRKIAGEIEEGSGDGFVEVAYQKRPEPRNWVVRSDGELAVQLFGPKEGVYGWARVPAAGGRFKSVCVIPGSPEDRVHVIVERDIEGETRVYHERFALQNFPIELDANGAKIAPDAWRLQSALISDGEPTSLFSGLDHLEGQSVSVWGDGRHIGSFVVTNGSIELESNPDDVLQEDGDGEFLLEDDLGVSLPIEVSKVIIGLNYVGRWKSSKLAYGAQLGTALTMDKNIGRLGMIVHETPVGAVKYGRSYEAATDQLIGEYQEGMLMDSAVPLWSNENSQPFEGETAIDPRVHLVMDIPAPVTILALIPQVELGEK